MENLDRQESNNTLKAFADILDALQKNKNEGRGVSHIQTIISFLRRGDVEKAKAVCFNESDKFSGLDDIKELLKKELFHKEKHPWEFDDRAKERLKK